MMNPNPSWDPDITKIFEHLTLTVSILTAPFESYHLVKFLRSLPMRLKQNNITKHDVKQLEPSRRLLVTHPAMGANQKDKQQYPHHTPSQAHKSV